MSGYRRGDIAFYVGKFPMRKKPCLWVEHGNTAYKLGQFNDEQSAKDFMAILNYVCFGNDEDKAYRIVEGYVKKD